MWASAGLDYESAGSHQTLLLALIIIIISVSLALIMDAPVYVTGLMKRQAHLGLIFQL